MSRISISTSVKIIKSVSNPDVLPVRVLALLYNSNSIELCECGNNYLIYSKAKDISMNINTTHIEVFYFDNIQMYGSNYIVKYKVYMSDGSVISKYSEINQLSDNETGTVNIYC